MNINSVNSSGMNFPKINSAAKVGFQNESDTIYAKKGEPTYVVEMDLDDDGIVTFDEFKDYCKENGLSADEVKQLLETRQLWELFKEMSQKREEEQEAKKEKDEIYAKQGDENYDESMDFNDDKKVTFDEYIKYCNENSNEQNYQKVNKFVDAYALKKTKEPEIKVEHEA